MTSSDAALAIGITQNYLSNVEHGRRKIAEDKLEALLGVYALNQRARDEMLALRKDSDGRGWWSRHSGALPLELLRFLGYEHGAEEVLTYESGLISGLLQTENYCHAVHSGDAANLRKSEVDRRVEVRLSRQKRLGEPEPLKAVIVMTEGVLRQQVGGPQVLAEQLEHILNLLEEHPENLTVRIIPFNAGSYSALGSSTFHVFTFPSERLMRLAWQETVTSLSLIENTVRIRQYSEAFSEALDRAADQETSKRLIRESMAAIT